MKKINSIKWMMLQLSVFGMTFAPVADGFAAEKVAKELNEARVKELMMELGVTKPQTIGGFFQKNKAKYPPRIQKLLNELFANHKNTKMPAFEIGSAKSSTGGVVPVVRIQAPGHMFNIEVHDNDKYFAKIGPTEITKLDINNFTTMMVKMYNNDYQLRRWVDEQVSESSAGASLQTNPGVKNEFSLPQINKDLWVKLSPEGRVQYILNMRNMWKDAMSVLMLQDRAAKQPKGKKTSSLKIIEEIWKLMNAEAEAADPTPAANRERTAVPGRVDGTRERVYDSSCLLAGYVDDYKKIRCDVNSVKKRYEANSLIKVAQDTCSANQIACNPLIFGMPGGKGKCIDIDAKPTSRFQKASHWDGPCEDDNKLSTTKISILKDDAKSGKDRYAVDNLKSEAEIKELIRKEQEETQFKETKAFLDGVMKSRNPELHALFTEKKIDDKVIELLQKINQDFTDSIGEARKACVTSGRSGRAHEPNFWGACDQMHRRQIFVADYLRTQIGCKDDAKMDMNTYKCICPAKFSEAGKPAKVVDLNNTCGGPIVTGNPAVCEPGKPGPDGRPCGAGTGGNKCGADGKMPDGKLCKDYAAEQCGKLGFELGEVTEYTDESIACVCKGGTGMASLADIKAGKFKKEQCTSGRPATTGCKDGLMPDGKTKCGAAAESSTSNEDQKREACEKDPKKKWKPGARDPVTGAEASGSCVNKSDDEEEGFFKRNKEGLIMLGVVGAFALWLSKSGPKKPSLNPPGDLCTSGQVICTGQCPNANQVKINGVCQCRQPSPQEVLVDAAQCIYGPNEGLPTPVTCPDGTTTKQSLLECPKQTCSDGSTVYVGQNCPTETPATKPTTTNTGDVQK